MVLQLDPSVVVIPLSGVIFAAGLNYHRLGSIEHRQRRMERRQQWYAENLLAVMARMHIPVSEFPDDDGR